MKITVAIFVSALANAAGASLKRSVGVGFGPRKCVTLSRSAAGSCVLTTDCEGADVSQTEFAFDCVGQGGDGGIVRHSFGVGGFEASEEFDTEVKCERCDTASPVPVKHAGMHAVKKAKVQAIMKPIPAREAPPPPPPAAVPVQPAVPAEVPVEQPPAPVETKVESVPAIPGAVSMYASSRSKTEVSSTNGAKATASSTAKAKFWPFTSWGSPRKSVKYGPKGCVSTWKNKDDHCMIATNCKGTDISNYEFGVVCVSAKGYPVKHLFGKDSFDEVETFDTLIKCDECLGLEEIPDETRLFGEVATMSKDIASLKAVLSNVSANVQMLNAEVFKGGPSPAPAPAPAPATVEPAAEKEVEPAAMVRLPVTNRRHTDHATVEHTDHATVEYMSASPTRNLRHSHKGHHHERRVVDDDDDREDDRADDTREEKVLRKPEVEYVAWSEFNGDHARKEAAAAAAAAASHSDEDEDDGSGEDEE